MCLVAPATSTWGTVTFPPPKSSGSASTSVLLAPTIPTFLAEEGGPDEVFRAVFLDTFSQPAPFKDTVMDYSLSFEELLA